MATTKRELIGEQGAVQLTAELKAEKTLTICARCFPNYQAPIGVTVSHGICPRHHAEQLAQIETASIATSRAAGRADWESFEGWCDEQGIENPYVDEAHFHDSI